MEIIPKNIVGIEFFNRQATKLSLWIELACIDVELESGVEYRVEAHENEFRIEFDGPTIIVYLQYQFGPKVLKRIYSTDFQNPGTWEVIADYSDI